MINFNTHIAYCFGYIEDIDLFHIAVVTLSFARKTGRISNHGYLGSSFSLPPM